MTAQAFLRKAGVRAGEQVLIYGASGSVGSYAVQLARHLGAHVTGVCGAANVAMVKSLGAHDVIDYTTVDFTRRECTYDVVFDAVGKTTASHCKSVLRKGGRFVSVKGSAKLQADDLDTLKTLIEANEVTSMIENKKGNVVVTVAHDGLGPVGCEVPAGVSRGELPLGTHHPRVWVASAERPTHPGSWRRWREPCAWDRRRRSRVRRAPRRSRS